MAKNCIDFFQQMEGAKNPVIPEAPTFEQQASSGDYSLRTADAMTNGAVAADNAMRDTCSTIITDAMGEPDPSAAYVGLERGDKALVDDIRYQLTSAENARQFNDVRNNHLNDIWSWINNLTTNAENLWLHTTTRIASAFVNARANMGEWFYYYANQSGRSILDQDVASMMSHLPARINGEMERLLVPAKRLNDIAKQIQNKLGRFIPLEQVKQMAGDWAILRHVLDDRANWRLIDRFDRRIAYLQTLSPQELAANGNRLGNELNVSIFRRDRLRQHINDPNPPDYLSCVGYTDAQARELRTKIEQTPGIDVNLLRDFGDELVAWNAQLLEEDAKAGRIKPHQYDALLANNFQYYVPVMLHKQNASGHINDTHPYYPGTYSARAGAADTPDDAYFSTLLRCRRVASNLAVREPGDRLMLLAQANEKNRRAGGEDNGLRIITLAKLESMKNSKVLSNSYLSDWAYKAEHSGGFVVDVPVYKNGQIVDTQKALVYFDPNWVGRNGLKGSDLNNALLLTQTLTPAERAVINVNSLYGQMFTRFRPWFGVVNAGRDGVERLTHMIARDFIDANGNTIAGWKLAASYATNLASAMKNLYGAKRDFLAGKGLNTKYGNYWKEFVRYGAHQDYTWGRDNSAFIEYGRNAERAARNGGLPEYLQGTKNAGMREVLEKAGSGKDAIINVLDEFNDYWNNIAPFAEFVTLRDAGIPAERAARNVLDSMDFQQQGRLTNPMRMVFPFVKPIMQSAAAMSRVLGFSYDPRGFAKASWKSYVALTVLGLGMKAMMDAAYDSMGEDEDGLPRIDQFSLSKLSRGIPFGIPGGENGLHFFLNTGYGAPRLLATWLWGLDRVQRGTLDANSFAGSMLLTYLQEMTPANWPEFSFTDNPAQYIMQCFCPAVLSPLTEAATNTNNFGTPIKRGDAPEFVSKADFGGGSSMKVYNKLAQLIKRSTGVDWYPEQVQHLIDGYLIGPAAMFKSIWEDDDPSYKQSEHYKDTHLDPWLECLGVTMSFGYADDVARGISQQAEKKLINIIKDERILKSAKGIYKTREEQEQWWYDQCMEKGLDDGTAQDIQSYFRLVDQLRQGKPEINAYLRGLVDSGVDYEEMQEQMDEMTKGRRDMYRNFVNNLNMYKR